MNCDLTTARVSAVAPDGGIASFGENRIIGSDMTATEAVLSLLDLDRLRASPLCHDPFDFVIVENFVRAEHLPGIVADFPPLGRHGSFPLAGQRHGAAFGQLAEEL